MDEVNLSESLTKAKEVKSFLAEKYGLNIGICYQCGKCAAGCPAADKMDYNSREIINLLKLGLFDQALRAKSVWYCASCDTCSTRCPRNVDPAAVMEAIHMEAKQRGIIADKPVDVFNSAFLKSVKSNGRVHEMSLMIKYNLITGKLLKDADYAPLMFFKGKLAVFPHKIKARQEMKEIFARCHELEVKGE